MSRKADSTPGNARLKKAASKKGAAGARAATPGGKGSARAKRRAVPILIIDDNDDFRETLCMVIRDEGYTVEGVSNGLEAGRMLATNAFALVLTDMFMPEKDGFQMIRDLRKLHPEIPIVAMSGGTIVRRGEHLKVARFFGAQAILRKPFSERQLFSTIESLVG